MRTIHSIATHRHLNMLSQNNNAYYSVANDAMYCASWNKIAFISSSKIQEPRPVATDFDGLQEGDT